MKTPLPFVVSLTFIMLVSSSAWAQQAAPPVPVDPDDAEQVGQVEPPLLDANSPAKAAPEEHVSSQKDGNKRKRGDGKKEATRTNKVITNPFENLGKTGIPRGDASGYAIGVAAGAAGALVGTTVGVVGLLGMTSALANIPPGQYSDLANLSGLVVAVTAMPFLGAFGAGAASLLFLVGGRSDEWFQFGRCVAGGYCAIMVIPAAVVGGAMGLPLANCLSAAQCGGPGGGADLPRPVAFAPALGALLGVSGGAALGYFAVPALSPPTAGGSSLFSVLVTGAFAVGLGAVGGGLGGALGVFWDRAASGDSCANMPFRSCLCGDNPSRSGRLSQRRRREQRLLSTTLVRGGVRRDIALGASMAF